MKSSSRPHGPVPSDSTQASPEYKTPTTTIERQSSASHTSHRTTKANSIENIPSEHKARGHRPEDRHKHEFTPRNSRSGGGRWASANERPRPIRRRSRTRSSRPSMRRRWGRARHDTAGRSGVGAEHQAWCLGLFVSQRARRCLLARFPSCEYIKS